MQGKENPGIHSDQLWQAYLDKAKSLDIQPITSRTFSKYCGKLRDIGLIRIEPAKVKSGYIRRFSITE